MSRLNTAALLDSLFKIRPGEGRQVGLMFLYLMGVVSTFIMGRTVRDTLFLNRVPIDKLALMYIAVAVCVSTVSYFYSRIADKYRRDQLIVRTLSIFTVITAGFWLLIVLKLAGAWLYPVLYVVIEIIGAISIIQFWTFANDIFSGRQAKRLFGLIGAGGVLSNITCGFTIGKVAPVLGSENLLLICSFLLFSCIILVKLIAQKASGDLELAIQKPKKKRMRVTQDTGTVLHSKHLKIIAGMVVLTFLTVTIVDYQFKVIAKSAFTQETELAAFFGYFYAFTGIIASFIQFFITGRMLERTGIAVALAVLPAAIMLGAGSMLLVPLISALITVTAAKGAENIFRYTVNDATMQLLYVPVPSHQRGRAKAFIDGILKPGSIGISGLVLFGLGTLMSPEKFVVKLAYLDVVLLGAWLALVLSIRKEYVKSLINTLRSRRLDLDTGLSRMLDDGTIKTLRARLRSEDEHEVMHALELLSSVRASFTDELILLLDHPQDQIRIRALKLIGDSGQLDAAASIHDLMSDGTPEIRAAAIGAFCAIGRERAVRAATKYLNDSSGVVRAAAVVALIRNGGLDGILSAAETLKHFLSSDLAEERLQGARVLGEIQVRNFFQPVLELLQDPHPSVRQAAVEAAGRMQSRELLPPLIYKLADPATNQMAVRAIANYGEPIEPTLFKVLENKHEDIIIRRMIPKILGQVGGQQAIDVLLSQLSAMDPELLAATAKASARIRERIPGVQVDEAYLEGVVRAVIKSAYQTLATILDLKLPGHILSEALYVLHRNALGLAFMLLEIRYPARTIQLVYANLDAENKAVRANALEVVDNVLDKDESRVLIPLLENQSIEQTVKTGEELFELERKSPDEWLEILLSDPHPWIVTCALYRAGELGASQLTSAVLEHVRSADAVIRETACLTLSKLVEGTDAPREELKRAAQEVSDDSVPEVRRASALLLGAL